MKYLLIGLFLSFNVYASNDIVEARSNISTKLNQVVKDLKSTFKPIDQSLNGTLDGTKTLKEDVDMLVERGKEDESNPTVLKHGKQKVKTSCDYDSENLNWTGSEWRCLSANVLSDCVAASDEYKISKSDGSYECKRSSSTSGGKLNSYWKFTGYSINCDSASGKYSNIYGCFYKNKLNQEIQIENSECNGKSKPSSANKTCTSAWLVGSWSVCSKSCGTGSQTRSVTCPDGKVCLSTKPETSQICNTQVCTTSWRTSSWSRCSKSCGTGTQTRSVTCPSGYVCSGTKPNSSQTCNTQACTASWAVGSWSACSKSCGTGTQSRSVTCPSGYVCSGTKPNSSQTCNTQACTASWTVGSWSTCSKPCGGGTQTRSVTCPAGKVCTGAKPSTSIGCNISVCSANWEVGPWSICRVDPVTGNGLKRRSVTCPVGYLCAGTKPAEFDACKGKSSIIIKDNDRGFDSNFGRDFGGNTEIDIDRGLGGKYGGSYNMRDARY